MPASYTREQIREGLITDLADGLCLDIEDMTSQATFFGDLGGESIDLLDLSFRMRQRFGIEASFRELLEAWEFDPSGQISPASIQRLEACFPQIEWSERISRMNTSNPRDLLTVELIEDILFHSQSTNVRVSNDAGRLSKQETRPAEPDLRAMPSDRITLPKPTE